MQTLTPVSNSTDFQYSGIKQLDYLQAILGLNQYRARRYSKKDMAYAEAFLCLDIEAYMELFMEGLNF